MLQHSCYTYTVTSKLRSTEKENNWSVPLWCPQSPLRSCRASDSPSPKDVSPAVKVSDQSQISLSALENRKTSLKSELPEASL